MSSIQESLSRLVETARQLRDIAGELGNLDLKSQIVDEISNLQDIHETLARSGDTSVDLPVTTDPPPPVTNHGTLPKPLGDDSMSVYTPAENAGTYALSGDTEASADAEPETITASDHTGPPESATDTAADTSQRATQAEETIAQLEQILQSTIRSMNSVLTVEQKRIKVRETRAAEGTGLTAGELRNRIYAAMMLSDEQKAQIASARKQISELRASIAEELTHLMDDEQRAKVKGMPESK